MTIAGSNLSGVTAVHFGGNSVAVLSDNGTTITATSPAGSLGTVDVTLVAAGGTSAVNQPADEFRYIAPPSAAAGSYAAPQGSPLAVAAPGVLAADTDPQGYKLSAAVVTNPLHGVLSLNSDGSFTYTPSLGYLGADRFVYTASDGYATSSPATVSITVGPATLVWTGTLLGDWTDAQWSGASLMTYPDDTANAIVQTPRVVQATARQAAYSLAISNGGQVAVAAGASLTVTTGTSVTGNGTLNVNAAGAFSTGGILTVDTGGSLIGGPVTAAAYQLNAGTVSANLSGPGGLTKDTGGTRDHFRRQLLRRRHRGQRGDAHRRQCQCLAQWHKSYRRSGRNLRVRRQPSRVECFGRGTCRVHPGYGSSKQSVHADRYRQRAGRSARRRVSTVDHLAIPRKTG